AAGPIVNATKALTGLVSVASGLPANGDSWVQWGHSVGEGISFILSPARYAYEALIKLTGMKGGPVKPDLSAFALFTPPKVAPTEKELIDALKEVNPLIQQRIDLTKKLKITEDAVSAAAAAHNVKDLALAQQSYADIKRQLDA